MSNNKTHFVNSASVDTNKSRNVFPVLDSIIPRNLKEEKLKQRSVVVWFTGLSGSGKTTLAIALEKELFKKGYLTQVLDGDNVRTGINNNLNFTKEDRIENIRRIAEVSKLFLECGIISICAFISPTEEMRQLVKTIVGPANFFEIYVSTSVEICEQRDIKGLYAKARSGELKDFTGINAPFEEPVTPDLNIDTSNNSIEYSTGIILEQLLPKIKI